MDNKEIEILSEQKKQIIEDEQTPLGTLDLSVRSYNCLLRAGINTVEKMIAMSEDELMEVRNLGRKGFEEVVKKITEIKEPQQTPLEILDLSVRSYNCLLRAGINTVEKLIAMSEDELMEVRNLGRKGFEEVVRIKNNIIQKLEIENSKNEVGQLKSETTLKKEKLLLYKKILESRLEQVAEELKNIENNGQSKK